MAYLRDITKQCADPACLKPATVELINRVNAPMGSYCQKHGTIRLKAVSKSEDRDA